MTSFLFLVYVFFSSVFGPVKRRPFGCARVFLAVAIFGRVGLHTDLQHSAIRPLPVPVQDVADALKPGR